MSEVMQRLLASEDPIENELHDVLLHWQDQKSLEGRRRDLGREPGAINAHGALEVISRRVLKGSAGFDEVDAERSYEAIVLRHPKKFSEEVVATARMRTTVGVQAARAFRAQEIKFIIKAFSAELFEEVGVPETEEAWLSRTVLVPEFVKELKSSEAFLHNGFRSLVWIHEKKKNDERGKGLTAIVEFGPPDAERNATVRDVFFLPHPVGSDVLEKHRGNDETLEKIRGFNHTRIWPVSEDAISILLSAAQEKSQQIAALNNDFSDPLDPDSTVQAVEKTLLREVVVRQYQSAFRKELLRNRPNVCAITGTGELSVLEAAHIVPYATKNPDRDRLQNGVLLRCDIHKLFDAGLIAIHPQRRVVCISGHLRESEYMALSGNVVGDDLSEACLRFHHENVFESN